MKRKLWLFNFLLIAAIALAGWQLRKESREMRAREHGVLDKRPPIPPAPVAPPAPPAPTVTAASYLEIADKMLFSKDRNSKVIVDPPKPVEVKPLPPLPAVYGMMNIGDGPTVMMSEKSGGKQRGIHPGEKIGEFKLVSANNDELVLAFEDRTVKKKLDELIDRGGAEAVVSAGPAGTGAASSPPPPPPPQGKAEPGVKVGEGLANCQSNDSSPAGTVVNGMRKVIRQTPFDTACYWEAVK